ncbi:MAG TPA: hypothetical protein VF006_08700 [Longimicrobium sp.]
MGSVLNTSFYLPFATRESDRLRSESALIQDLLCYETVLVLTDHMAAVGMLGALLGPKTLREALDSGAIKFINDRNLLSWPVTGRAGQLSPILPMRAQPTDEDPNAFTETSLPFLGTLAAEGFGLTQSAAIEIARAAAESAIDFSEPLTPSDRVVSSGGRGLRDDALGRLRTYQDVVPRLSSFPVKLGDLIRLERDLRNPARSPLNTRKLKLLKGTLETGWHVADQPIQMGRKQLGLLNLFLCDHFLAIHAAAAPESTLHTEKIVEEILTARATSIRRAVGEELSDVLRMASVEMPQLAGGSTFPYDKLLTIRGGAAARDFRKVVDARDATPNQDLIRAYYSALGQQFGGRLSVKVARFVLTSVAGFVPGLGTALSAADSFLLDRLLGRRDARYFIDEELTRLGKD